MNYQNKELIKKLYLLRINMIMYHTFYGMMCMNFGYYFDENIDNFEVEDLKIKANPSIISEKSIPELEVMMVDKVCKYLDKLKVYDLDYDVNDVGELDNEELDEIEREYEEYKFNNNDDDDNEWEKHSDSNDNKIKGIKSGKGEKSGKKKFYSKLNYRRKLRKELQRKIYNVVKVLKESKQCGNVPLGADAFVEKVDKKEVNWKETLRNFIQFDVNDYSFMPPDKRYDDSPFYLPDYNDEIEKVENILFMIDASGSMSDKLVSVVFNEIKNCIAEFQGKVKGYIGSFDVDVYNVTEFNDEDEFDKFKVKGRGGTSFHCIFNHINNKMKHIDLKTVVILTDGYAEYPDESLTRGLPILWLIINKVSNPTCGKVVRIEEEK